MVELFSNFILIPIERFIKGSEWDQFIVLTLNDCNVEETVKVSTNEYKNLKNILIVYSEKNTIEYFLSIFTFYEGNIKKRKEFEDLLMMNECVFLA